MGIFETNCSETIGTKEFNENCSWHTFIYSFFFKEFSNKLSHKSLTIKIKDDLPKTMGKEMQGEEINEEPW